MKNKVKFEFVESHYHTRYPCHVCGGWTDKWAILCEVNRGKYKGMRVCEECLKAGKDKIEEHLRARIAGAEAKVVSAPAEWKAYAERLRALLGRMEVPTYAAWEEAMKKDDEELLKEYARQERLRSKRKTEPSTRRGYERYAIGSSQPEGYGRNEEKKT